MGKVRKAAKKQLRVAFSGLFCSGKDYCAEQAGFHVVSIAEPMYRACEYFFGSCNKKREDHRKFLQYLGQLGWGCPTCVHDATAANLIWTMRNHGAEITTYGDVNWHEFGHSSDFWIRIALRTVEYCRSHEKKIAITNARFEHEIKPLKEAGFDHYLVRCSYELRASRNGGKISTLTDQDVSEKYARELEPAFPPDKTIWNDCSERPLGGSKFLTVGQFVKKMQNV